MEDLEKSVVPYVNLNGNSRRQLQEQLYDIMEALDKTIHVIARADIDHGRNAVSRAHETIMRTNKMTEMGTLAEMHARFEEILKTITI